MKIQKRPESLSEVAERCHTEEAFGRELADFEHELLLCSSRKELSASLRKRPPLLWQAFETGAIADAWLAAYAEELAFRFGLPYPDWIWEADRFLNVPYIHDAHSQRLKAWHVFKAPAGFTRRNLFVDLHLPPIPLRPGRPRKSAEHKREMNRRRVARHRAAKKR